VLTFNCFTLGLSAFSKRSMSLMMAILQDGPPVLGRTIATAGLAAEIVAGCLQSDEPCVDICR